MSNVLLWGAGAVPLIGYLAMVLFVGRLLVYNDVFKRRRPGTEALEGYSVEDVVFTGQDENRLSGWFVTAPDNPTGRTVVLLHGWHRDRLRLLSHIRLFVDAGMHVLIYDQRSHGASDTALISFGYGEAGDLLAALDYLHSRAEVDPDRIAAVGFSLGTGGIIYAIDRANRPLFKAVVLEGAYSRSFDVGRHLLTQRFGSFIGHLIGILLFTPGAKLCSLGRFKHSEPIRFIQKVSPIPLLLIRGDQDDMVPLENFREIRDQAMEPKTLWIHDGGHTRALSTYPAEYRDRVLGFLEEHL